MSRIRLKIKKADGLDIFFLHFPLFLQKNELNFSGLWIKNKCPLTFIKII
jgi:hypothetical protein